MPQRPSQAIVTSVLLPTPAHPRRIKATCSRGSLIIPSDGAFDELRDHYRAARLLCDRFISQDFRRSGQPRETNPWSRPFETGQLPSMDYVHVFLSQHQNAHS